MKLKVLLQKWISPHCGAHRFIVQDLFSGVWALHHYSVHSFMLPFTIGQWALHSCSYSNATVVVQCPCLLQLYIHI